MKVIFVAMNVLRKWIRSLKSGKSPAPKRGVLMNCWGCLYSDLCPLWNDTGSDCYLALLALLDEDEEEEDNGKKNN